MRSNLASALAGKVEMRLPVKQRKLRSPARALNSRKATLKYHKKSKPELLGGTHLSQERSMEIHENSMESIHT